MAYLVGIVLPGLQVIITNTPLGGPTLVIGGGLVVHSRTHPLLILPTAQHQCQQAGAHPAPSSTSVPSGRSSSCPQPNISAIRHELILPLAQHPCQQACMREPPSTPPHPAVKTQRLHEPPCPCSTTWSPPMLQATGVVSKQQCLGRG